MPSDDRDQQFERALAHHLRKASTDAGCPDAEILAAYHERTLSLEEMAQWKQHIAACSLCQEALALVEKSESILAEEWNTPQVPEMEEVVAAPRILQAASAKASEGIVPMRAAAETPGTLPRQIRRRPPLVRWIVPLGALAAGLLVWVGVRETRVTQKPAAIEIAENPQTAAQTEPNTESASPRDLKAEYARKQSETFSDTVSQASPSQNAPELSQRLKTPPARANESQIASKDQAAKTQRELDYLTAGKLSAPKVPAAPAPAPKAPEVTATTAAVSANAVPESRQASPPSPTAGAMAGAMTAKQSSNFEAKSARSDEKKKERAEAEEAVTVESEAKGAPAFGARHLRNLALQDPHVISVPGGTVAWRVHAGGGVERTTDGGKKWKMLQTGVNVELSSGSAPSANVCWIAGKSGTLLLTTDGGRNWKLISTPITEDLGGVHATDDQHATIWDVPNHRSFETSDSGGTWNPAANE
jgi:hypothetical protein